MNERNECLVKTPEGVVFRLYPAGLPSRLLACVIDVLMIAAISSVFSALTGLGFLVLGPVFVIAGQVITSFLLTFLYWISLEWLWNGRTVGKKLLRLRVVDSGGLKLLPRQVIVRNLLRSVDFLPLSYLLGASCAFLDPRSRRLGDIAAGTMVIREIVPGRPDLSSVLPEKYNSLRDFPLEGARLRDAVSAEESRLLLDALIRRDSLSPDARCDIYADLATLIHGKVQFPQEAIEGVPDENFLRNVVDILYKT
jgi:uncharacterized RDD family membrane protein YckC